MSQRVELTTRDEIGELGSWFNKFVALDDTDLKARIESLLERNGFASRGIFVVG